MHRQRKWSRQILAGVLALMAAAVLPLQAAHHLEAVDIRKHEVQDDHVRPLGLCITECVAPVPGDIRLVSRPLEITRNDVGDRRLVVDDENLAPSALSPLDRHLHKVGLTGAAGKGAKPQFTGP